MKLILILFSVLLSFRADASLELMGPYELKCLYYWSQSDGTKNSNYYEKTLRFEDRYSSDIPLVGKINLHSSDGLYNFKVVAGDEGTQFITITNKSSKAAVASMVEIQSDINDEATFNSILIKKGEDFQEGFYSGEAGIFCSIEKT